MGIRRSGTNHSRVRKAVEGFTLLEMVVVITIIAILAASLVPVLTSPNLTGKRLETVNEMQQIERAIIGRPEYGDYGFLGTMGRLPVAASADIGFASELLSQGVMPTATAQPTSPVGVPQGVPVGWNGPYLKSEYQDPTRDGWAQPYTIETSGTKWRIVSSGPDRITQITIANNNNGGVPCDDIVYPSQQIANVTTGLWFLSTGSMIIDVWGDLGTWQKALYKTQTTEITSVAVWYPDGAGSLMSATCNPILDAASNETNSFKCDDIPFGLHTVQVTLNGALDEFQNYTALSYVFNQNFVHEQQNTFARLTIPLNANTSGAVTRFQQTGDHLSNSTTPAIGLSGKGTDGTTYTALPSGAFMQLATGTVTRNLLGDVTSYGGIAINGASTTCTVVLESIPSPDGGTTWNAATEMARLVVGPSGSATATLPFSVSGGSSSFINNLVAFRVSVFRSGGTGDCTMKAGTEMVIRTALASP